jgi:AcrR family transcriptional regulator
MKSTERRQYTLGRRGEAAAETRRRILQATFDLHAEQGIRDTTMQQIAARAGVSVGTVYHHFPTYADAIDACGAHASVAVPAPDARIFDGAETRRERVERLTLALFDFYRRLPALASIRRDRDLARSLSEYADAETAGRVELCASALGREAQSAETATLAALVDLDVAAAFTRQGFTADVAASAVAAIANAWLDTLPQPSASRI